MANWVKNLSDKTARPAGSSKANVLFNLPINKFLIKNPTLFGTKYPSVYDKNYTFNYENLLDIRTSTVKKLVSL